MKQLVLLFLCVFALAACTDPLEENQAINQVPHAIDAMIMSNPPSWDRLSIAEKEARIFAALSVLHEGGTEAFMSVARSESTLLRKDELASAMIQYDGLGAELVQQIVAANMLELHLSATSPELEVVEHYTRLAVDTGYPGANVMATALSKLEGYWSPHEIREAAAASHAASTRWMIAHCFDCAEGGKLRLDLIQEHAPANQRAVYEGMARLTVIRDGIGAAQI